MYVKVAALDLPRAVRTRLLELAGPDAYEEGKDLLTLKTQKKRTYVCQISLKDDLQFSERKQSLCG